MHSVMGRIRCLPGVNCVEIGKVGEINVYIEGRNRDLREEILSIGAGAMLAIRVWYNTPAGIIGEDINRVREDVSDYYKPVYIPGFGGAAVEAPPEEVAAEPKGALKLKRLRGKTRGRPVVGWKYGESEVRKGTEIKFKQPASLKWTMNRAMNVKPGATATVTGMSTNRPVVYLALGGYDGVECPVHSIGHAFEINQPKKTKVESIDDETGYRASEIARMVNAVGFGQNPGWGRPDDDEKKAKGKKGKNSPHLNDPDITGPATARWDDGDAHNAEEDVEEEDCGCAKCSKAPVEDMMAPPNDKNTGPVDQRFSQKKPVNHERMILFGRK